MSTRPKGHHARAYAPILSVGSGARNRHHAGHPTGGRDLGGGPHRVTWRPLIRCHPDSGTLRIGAFVQRNLAPLPIRWFTRKRGRSCGALQWTTTVSLSLPRRNSPISKRSLDEKLRTDQSRLLAGRHAQAPAVLDHSRALPQGDGRAGPAFTGGARSCSGTVASDEATATRSRKPVN